MTEFIVPETIEEMLPEEKDLKAVEEVTQKELAEAEKTSAYYPPRMLWERT